MGAGAAGAHLSPEGPHPWGAACVEAERVVMQEAAGIPGSAAAGAAGPEVTQHGAPSLPAPGQEEGKGGRGGGGGAGCSQTPWAGGVRPGGAGEGAGAEKDAGNLPRSGARLTQGRGSAGGAGTRGSTADPAAGGGAASSLSFPPLRTPRRGRSPSAPV